MERKLIRYTDGSFEFPAMGQPPDSDAYPGYTPSPGNPWRFFPQWVPCDHRKDCSIMVPCKTNSSGQRKKEQHSCAARGDVIIDVMTCLSCKHEPKLIALEVITPEVVDGNSQETEDKRIVESTGKGNPFRFFFDEKRKHRRG